MPSLLEGSGQYEFRAGPLLSGQELRVLSFEGREGISECYRFDIELACAMRPLTLQLLLLGTSASFSIPIPGRSPRGVAGVVSKFEILGPHDADEVVRYRVRLTPRLSLLSRRKNSRIYQDRTAREIIDEVLAGLKINARWFLTRSLSTRAYAVQYQESDYDFVLRLLAEEGIYFYFEQPSGLGDSALAAGATGLPTEGLFGKAVGAVSTFLGGAQSGETVVFSDSDDYPTLDAIGLGMGLGASDAGGTLATAANLTATGTFSMALDGPVPELELHPELGMNSRDEYVSAFRFRRRMRSKSVNLRDADFMRPGVPRLGVASLATVQLNSGAALSSAGELSFTPGGDVAAVGFSPTALEHYEHNLGSAPVASKDVAARLLGQLRADAAVAKGQSVCARLSPGHKFKLAKHPVTSLNAEYVVTAVHHVGAVASVLEAGASSEEPSYSNRFQCVPIQTIPRPRAPARRRVATMEPARVAGPAGAPVFTDPLGRIRVQFFWDRQGTLDETSSCWVRVAQAATGPSEGSQFIPRVGSDVLVQFCGGDVDRPLVVGCLPGPLNPLALDPMAVAETWGIRTRTLGGDGYNELSLRDVDRRVVLRSQRDLLEESVGPRTVVAGLPHAAPYDDAELRYSLEVRGSSASEVSGDYRMVSLAHETQQLAADLDVQVEGDVRSHVVGHRESTVRSSHTQTVAEHLSLSVSEGVSALISGDDRLLVEGKYVATFGGDSSLSVLGNHGTSAQIEALSATENLTLSAIKELHVRCGRSEVVLYPDRIEIHGKNHLFSAATTLKVHSGNSLVALDGSSLNLHTTGKVTAIADGSIGLASGDAKVSVAAKSGGSVVVEAAHTAVNGSTSTLDLKDDAVIQGGMVKLESPVSSTASLQSESEDAKRTWFDILVTDQLGAVMAGVAYQVTGADGNALHGTTDSEGKAHIEGPEGSTTFNVLDHDASAVAPGKATETASGSDVPTVLPLEPSASISQLASPIPKTLDELGGLVASGLTLPDAPNFTWKEAIWLNRWKRPSVSKDVAAIEYTSRNKKYVPTESEIIENIVKQGKAFQHLRTALALPFSIHCWLRPPNYNELIGGAKQSIHMRGGATDFHVVGLGMEEVRNKIRKDRSLYPGRGENDTAGWVHLDLFGTQWFNP